MQREETEEERRARRLAKKAAKEARKAETVAGYSNSTNPFNDPNLNEQFVWGKKQTRDGTTEQEARATAKRRRHEVAAELQKVKESREKGEREREAWEAEKRQLDKEREQMAFADNQRREDEFQLQQERSRAVRRVEEGRARLVDLLTAGLSLLESDAAPSELLPNEVPDPLAVFEHSSEAELRELQGEISRHSDLDSGNADFWAAMGLVCDDALQASSGDTTVTAEVRGEIDAMLDGKSPAELDELQGQIVELARQDTNADYWGAVLARLRLVRARAVLSGAHGRMRRRQAEVARAGGGGAGGGAGGGGGAGAGSSSGAAAAAAAEEEEEEEEEGGAGAEVSELLATHEAAAEAEADGRYSPEPLSARQVDASQAVDAESDAAALQAARRRARSASRLAASKAGPAAAAGPTGPADGAAAEGEGEGDGRLVQAEARKGMEAGEARFSVEVAVEEKAEWWHDKYRPRKPKYFNRVHTGYEWNKYNQTHYDHDNPPPKMVQGYKFNVFYPDLIDRRKTPTYSLSPDPGSSDTCILRFHGGPPYEDIAFKIVNQEWETNHKRGFRCRFERGILQLYFNFKRHRYRR